MPFVVPFSNTLAPITGSPVASFYNSGDFYLLLNDFNTCFIVDGHHC